MKKLTTTILLSLMPLGAFAGVFQADITVTNLGGSPQTQKFDFDTADNFFNQLKTDGFKKDFPGYDSRTSIVRANTVYQGLPITVEFPKSGGADANLLILSIPALGVNKAFKGSSRSDSTSDFEHYLRNDTDHTYTRIVEYQVANTPNSQLAGNPTSLQGQLIGATFNYAANIPTATGGGSSGSSSGSGSKSSSGSSGGSSSNPLAVGVGGGTFSQRGVQVSVINVPISKAIDIDSGDPRKKLLLNGQFNYITVGQAASFQGSLGIGYMHPVSDRWYLIPSVSYGAIGSKDLASLGQIFSASLASNYQFQLAGLDMGLVNMFGFYKTLPLSIGGVVSSDPNINNYVFKNGIFPSKVLPFLFGHDIRVKGIFTDTEFTGSKVFVRQYNEIGVELSSVKKVAWLDKMTFGMVDALSISGKYVFSAENPNNFEGYDIGLSYDF